MLGTKVTMLGCQTSAESCLA